MKGYSVYSRIQQLKEKGFRKASVAKQLNINRRTVNRYWNMTADEYETYQAQICREKLLSEYETAILGWLRSYPGMSAAQVCDWLKEHYSAEFSERTVSRYVNGLRIEYGIKKKANPREYEAVPELPMGQQLQADFGGMPHELVFDQDSLVCVSENCGDIIHTYEFEKLRQECKFSVYLCRGNDPESKGKIENVVKYVKGNFLENRLYIDDGTLNNSLLDWLDRTANARITERRSVFQRKFLRKNASICVR